MTKSAFRGSSFVVVNSFVRAYSQFVRESRRARLLNSRKNAQTKYTFQMFRQSVSIVPMLTSDIVCISFLLSGHQCRCVVIENKNSKKTKVLCLSVIRAWILLNTLSIVDSIRSPCMVLTQWRFSFLKTRIALNFMLTATLYQFLCIRISLRTSMNQLNHLRSRGITFNFAS